MLYTFIKQINTQPSGQLSLFSSIRYIQPDKTQIITTDIQNISENLRNKAAIKEQDFLKIADSILKTSPKPTETMQEYYTTFRIPKKTGGFREINAPNEQLKYTQWCISKLLSYNTALLTHNAAYAYVAGRNHIEALKKHQENQSKWFLKLDIKDFFPSCTKALVMQQLSLLYPIALWQPSTLAVLEKLIHLCCLNGTLPQGSPASPLLSNLLFLQYDHTIQNLLINGPVKTQKFVYTRYADDMCISSQSAFDFKLIQSTIQALLQPHFLIKQEKTRYGSTAGRNWNLGLMLNKDNKITTGAVNKRNLKAMLHNFIIAEKEDKIYSIPELQRLLGIINYATQVEYEYITYLINKYSHKYDLDIIQTIKYRLKAALR